MINVKVVEFIRAKGLYRPVEINDLTDTGIGMAIHDCKTLIEKLEDAHRKLMDEDGAERGDV